MVEYGNIMMPLITPKALYKTLRQTENALESGMFYVNCINTTSLNDLAARWLDFASSAAYFYYIDADNEEFRKAHDVLQYLHMDHTHNISHFRRVFSEATGVDLGIKSHIKPTNGASLAVLCNDTHDRRTSTIPFLNAAIDTLMPIEAIGKIEHDLFSTFWDCPLQNKDWPKTFIAHRQQRIKASVSEQPPAQSDQALGQVIKFPDPRRS